MVTEYEKLPDREESRYVLDASRAHEIHERLGGLFVRIDHPDPVTQTAHLTGDRLDHAAAYLRIRKYLPALCADTLTLDLDDQWFFELKQKSGAKERIRQPLGEILVGTSYPELDDFRHTFPGASQAVRQFGRPLMPIFASQSHRTHYQAPGARLTVDEDMSYYGIRWGELLGYRLGGLQAVKAEIKIEKDYGKAAAEQFEYLCLDLDGTPASDDETAKVMFAAYQRFLETVVPA